VQYAVEGSDNCLGFFEKTPVERLRVRRGAEANRKVERCKEEGSMSELARGGRGRWAG